jgi:hypothetical protein
MALSRALLRQHGYGVPPGGAETFGRRGVALAAPGRLLSEVGPVLGADAHSQRSARVLRGLSDEPETSPSESDQVVAKDRLGRRQRKACRRSRSALLPPLGVRGSLWASRSRRTTAIRCTKSVRRAYFTRPCAMG